jgi:hypothetical protein
VGWDFEKQNASFKFPVVIAGLLHYHYLHWCCLCQWPKYEHIKGSTVSSFQTQFLEFVWISSNKIHSKINIFHTLVLKIVKYTLLNMNCQGAFQQHQEHPQIPIHFSVSILFSFHWENCSIINSVHTVAPNSLKPSWCSPTHQELSKDTNNVAWNSMVQESSAWQNETK